MERKIDPREQLRVIEPLLEKYEGLSEKHFDAEMVKAELEKLSKEELVELQVRMFAQYHDMAKSFVELAEALKVALQSQDMEQVSGFSVQVSGFTLDYSFF